MIVPKCREAIDAIPEDLVLGYPRGYSDQLAHEFSDPADWRGRRVHILGGSPRKQMNAIEQLTRPTLSGDPPADIVRLDWNGLHRGAQFGEFWSADGWDDSGRDADHVTVRKLVRHSLDRIKVFWESQGIWTETRLHNENITLEYEGPTLSDLSSAACAACGANIWTTVTSSIGRRTDSRRSSMNGVFSSRREPVFTRNQECDESGVVVPLRGVRRFRAGESVQHK